MIFVIAAYSLTVGVLALYIALLQHRSRAAAATLLASAETADTASAVASDPCKGFKLGASLLAPFWMWTHGMRISGAILLLVDLVIWPIYQRELWLPLLFVAMLPAADALATSRGRRGVGLVLLALSVLSASYPTWNPWTHPWLTNLLLYLEWIKF